MVAVLPVVRSRPSPSLGRFLPPSTPCPRFWPNKTRQLGHTRHTYRVDQTADPFGERSCGARFCVVCGRQTRRARFCQNAWPFSHLQRLRSERASYGHLGAYPFDGSRTFFCADMRRAKCLSHNHLQGRRHAGMRECRDAGRIAPFTSGLGSRNTNPSLGSRPPYGAFFSPERQVVQWAFLTVFSTQIFSLLEVL